MSSKINCNDLQKRRLGQACITPVGGFLKSSLASTYYDVAFF